MAEKDDASKRAAGAEALGKSERRLVHPSPEAIEALHLLIETERARLMKAVDTLSCVLAAMEKESGRFTGPYYPNAIEVARDLVSHTLDELDSVRLKPIMSALRGEAQPASKGAKGAMEIKEPNVTYLKPRVTQH
ncbi:MAG TPA: hypothetical protein VK025_16070 [Steroidobacter sp.]|jgi:hypothetical protein|nr:hypothetical protein [Steroidobacteraceae bacterium]HLS82918.1 hypothetical protein [Steroidobacter sp.]